MAKKKRKKNRTKQDPERMRLADASAAVLLDAVTESDPVAVFEAEIAASGLEPADIIQAVGRKQTVEALNFLFRLSGQTDDKPVLKAVRTAIFQLESAGITPSKDARPVGTGIIRPPEAKKPSGHLAGYDHLGRRPGILAVPSRTKGYDAAAFIVSSITGLVDFQALTMTETGVARAVDKLGADGPSRLIEVPPECVRFLLAEAATLSRRLGARTPPDYEPFISLLGGVPLLKTHPIYDLISDPGDAFTELATELLDHPLLTGLTLIADLDPYLTKLQEAETSVLVLSEAQKIERRQSVLDEAAREIFGPDRLHRLRREMEETALLLFQTGEPDLARAALSAAVSLENSAEEPHLSPLPAELMRKTAALFLQSPDSSQSGDSDSIRHPGSSSGLIIGG